MRHSKQLRTYLYKACPRCHGDLVLDIEESPRLPQARLAAAYACLQCGRRFVLAGEGLVPEREPVGAGR